MTYLHNGIYQTLKRGRYLFQGIKKVIPQSKKILFRDAEDYWNKSTQNGLVRDMSHWRGEGRFEDEIKWNQIGREHLDMVKDLCLLAQRTTPISSMVEWGPGGGANAIWFCREVEKFYGVDISEANLEECERQIKANHLDGFSQRLVEIDDPEKCLDTLDSPVDLFLSTAVYQHFPSKSYGKRITGIAKKLLAKDGIALIQIRYDDGSVKFKPKTRNYKKSFVTFTSFAIHEFWEDVTSLGFTPLAVKLIPSVNYAYFFLKKADNQNNEE